MSWELVDQDVREFLADRAALVGVALGESHHQQDEVLEVDRVGGAQALVVLDVDALGRFVEVRIECHVVGAAALLLLAENAREHRARRVPPLVELEVAHDALHDGALIGGVVDQEVGIYTDRCAEAAQQLGGGGVEGAHPQIPRDLAEHAFEPVTHLASGLVGEGDAEDAVGRDVLARDEIGDAVGDDAGLAGAGSGEHQQWPTHVQRGRELRVVQFHRGPSYPRAACTTSGPGRGRVRRGQRPASRYEP